MSFRSTTARTLMAAMLGFVIVASSSVTHASDLAAGLDAYKVRDFDRALSIWKPLAVGGNIEAQFHIGELCTKGGGGVPCSRDEANRWYRLAATQGHFGAQLELGNSLHFGGGDVTEAIEWLTKAAETGAADAQHSLGLLYHTHSTAREFVKARLWYGRAMDQGHMEATVSLAVLHSRGHGGPRDSALAVQLFRTAAERGSARAMGHLGDVHNDGKAMPRDAAEAARWYRKGIAAEKGEGVREPIMSLATLYWTGDGVPKDPVMAYAYAFMAARVGMKSAWGPAQKLADKYGSSLTQAELTKGVDLALSVRSGNPLPESSTGWQGSGPIQQNPK